MNAEGNGSRTVMASVWMVALTLALFFVPLINGLVAGLVGGYYAGHWKRALAAAVLPAIVAAIGLWIIFAVFNGPVWGLVAGGTIGALIIFADLGIFLGAPLGGAIAQAKKHRGMLKA